MLHIFYISRIYNKPMYMFIYALFFFLESWWLNSYQHVTSQGEWMASCRLNGNHWHGLFDTQGFWKQQTEKCGVVCNVYQVWISPELGQFLILLKGGIWPLHILSWQHSMGAQLLGPFRWEVHSVCQHPPALCLSPKFSFLMYVLWIFSASYLSC